MRGAGLHISKKCQNFTKIYIGGGSSFSFILNFFMFTVANVDYFSDVLLISINH